MESFVTCTCMKINRELGLGYLIFIEENWGKTMPNVV